MHGDRSEIRVHFERASKSEQSLFRAQSSVGIVPTRATDGAEQHGVGVLAKLQCFGWQRRAARVDCAATDQAFPQLKGMAPSFRDIADGARTFRNYLRPIPVAWQQRDLQR